MQKSVQARENRIIWNISRKASTSKASICFHLMGQRQNQGVRSTATAKPLDFGVINEWAIPIGIAHFQKEKDKSEFEKVSEWDTMEEYDNVER